jgi:hypothetical protein
MSIMHSIVLSLEPCALWAATLLFAVSLRVASIPDDPGVAKDGSASQTFWISLSEFCRWIDLSSIPSLTGN